MGSGSYFPPPVKAAPIPKESGGVRVLGIPTVTDRIAQTTAKIWLELRLDPPSTTILMVTGRANRAGGDRRRQMPSLGPGLGGGVRHSRAVRQSRSRPPDVGSAPAPSGTWILLYVDRWLKAPMQSAEGQLQARNKGTPQRGIVASRSAPARRWTNTAASMGTSRRPSAATPSRPCGIRSEMAGPTEERQERG